eukprot:TRINITY_DN1808_c0_g1_i1.p1 TRINITY_DN1808_c0_g1~~TRINITY_DN1808_c0_g1_i1.p1  ORF type:complete len:198 (+),score=25.40 TRINITY_DN1808_c0_g1_i1:57-650(+)
MTPNHDHLLKLLMVGDSDVGKSSLLNRFTDDSSSDQYVSTIGIDFKIKSVTVNDKIIKMQIWDTAGQERFRTITSSYYRGAHGILVVYDVANLQSYQNVIQWLVEIERYAGEQSPVIVLIGNKCDLSKDRAVNMSEAQNFAEEKGIRFLETSAELLTNVDEAFMIVAREVMNKFEFKFTTSPPTSPSVRARSQNCQI